MKTDQKGYMAYLALAITGAVILLIMTSVYQEKSIPEPEKTQEAPPASATVTGSAPKKPAVKITKQEITRASYSISAQFDNLRTSPRDVIFPPSATPTELSGSLYIVETGEVLTAPSTTKRFERFYIEKFEYTDSGETAAYVTLKGGTGDRVFTVWNVDGRIVTSPVTTD